MQKIRLFHLDPSEETRKLIQSYVENEKDVRLVGQAASLSEGMKTIMQIHPDVVVLDYSVSPNDLSKAVQQLLLSMPYVTVVVTSIDPSHARLKLFMNVGVRGVLIKPFTQYELIEAIRRPYTFTQELKESFIKNNTKIVDRSPQVITVFSTKGGVGKSTLCTLLAAGLAMFYREDTLIMDLDLQFGDVSLLLDIKPQSTITSVVEGIEQLTGEGLRRFTTKHPIGLNILPSPLNPEEADFITEPAMSKIIQLARQEFNYILVDCPPGFTDQVMLMLEQSDLVLLITSPELVSLKNTKAGIKVLREIGIPNDRIRVIVNRYSPKSHFTAALIEDVLGLPVSSTIAEDYGNMVKFLNQGQPELLFASKSQVQKDLRRLIEGIRRYHVIGNSPKKGWRIWPFKKMNE